MTNTNDIYKDKVTIGDATLYLGDCKDILPILKPQGCDLLVIDPPYGMGKEKDGVINDNLYNKKLDEFIFDCWQKTRPHLKDNSSAYIFGNAERLWGLWYGYLKDSERLTFRNEIAWDKRAGGFGLKSELSRCYFPTERCLFFMLGEQGFNNNADNYWEGWEPIRAYLDGERLKMGWSKPQVEKILGSVNKTQHIFSNSHFNLIQEKDYIKLQKASKHDAFKKEYDELKKEYDELKKEFYALRAYFNATHDVMTDIWFYQPVKESERHGHPTPKPVAMMQRIIMTSCPPQGTVIDTFMGSCPTGVACAKLDRKFIGIEIDEGYFKIACDRIEREYNQGKLF